MGDVRRFILPRIDFIHTFSHGEDTYESLSELNNEKLSISKTDLCLIAVTRDIDTGKGVDYMMDKYLEQLPTEKWQKDVLVAYSGLDKDTKEATRLYASYGFSRINEALRRYDITDKNITKRGYHIIQEGIDKMPPLDTDIIVYRFTSEFPGGKTDYISGEIENFRGYLSTSIDNLFVSDIVCHDKDDYFLMRIRIPKGKKAIFIPSSERELLFSHNTALRFIRKTKGVTCVTKTSPKTVYIKDNYIYDWEML